MDKRYWYLIERKIRPHFLLHGFDIEIVRLVPEKKTLEIRFLGSAVQKNQYDDYLEYIKRTFREEGLELTALKVV
jgi:hypothetical protein